MITLEHITRSFGDLRAVDDVSLEIESGEIYGIVGQSGAGKSTLARIVNLIERPDSGRVIVDGVDLTALPERELRRARRQIGMVFQRFNLLGSRSVRGNVELALELDGTAGARRTARAQEMLDLVGLGDRADASVHELYRLRTSQDTADVRTRAGAAWSSRSSRRNASQPDRRRKGSAARRGPSSFFRSIRPRGAGVGSRRASHPRAPAEARSRRPSARGGRRLPWPAGPCRTGCRSSPRPRRRLRGRTGP